MGTREDLPEGADSVLEGDELALETSEDLGDGEGLRHETLDLTSTLDLFVKKRRSVSEKRSDTNMVTYSQLVLFRQLIHTKNGNDILERLVVLEDLLDSGGNLVVLGTDL